MSPPHCYVTEKKSCTFLARIKISSRTKKRQLFFFFVCSFLLENCKFLKRAEKMRIQKWRQAPAPSWLLGWQWKREITPALHTNIVLQFSQVAVSASDCPISGPFYQRAWQCKTMDMRHEQGSWFPKNLVSTHLRLDRVVSCFRLSFCRGKFMEGGLSIPWCEQGYTLYQQDMCALWERLFKWRIYGIHTQHPPFHTRC